MTLDELSNAVCEILFECGVFTAVDFSTVVEHFKIPTSEKSDIEKIIDLVPASDKIEVIMNIDVKRVLK